MIPDIDSSVIAIIDVQEKFAPAIPGFAECIARLSVLTEAAKELKLPVIITEQYPKGLGKTVREIASSVPENTPYIEKTSFSCLGSDAFRKELARFPKESLVITGVETHVCILQTALNAKERGYEVYVPADAVASRRESDKNAALDLMRHAGIHVVSVEMLILMLLRDSAHPSFRAISKIIR